MNLKSLNKCIAQARVSPMLKQACEDIKEAISQEDYSLAYQISACKSYITGSIDPDRHGHAFQEDEKYNRRNLGGCVYSLLDAIHFEMAEKANQMPSGMTMVTEKGVQTGYRPAGEHPVIQRIKYEDDTIRKECEERIQQRNNG